MGILKGIIEEAAKDIAIDVGIDALGVVLFSLAIIAYGDSK